MPCVVITGASEGIGAEIALQLSRTYRSRLQLVLGARSASKLKTMAKLCGELGADVVCVPTDVSIESDCRKLVHTAIARFERLNVLINNAGISAHANFRDVSADHLHWYEQVMRTNFWGSVWCTHAALPYLQASRGRIVAVSSVAGLVGVPGRTAYSASKFAMSGFFEALRTELKPSGVSVTLAYPGVVDTRIRVNGLNAVGEAAGISGLKEEKAMPVAECARRIISGLEHRQREVVMTTQAKVGRFLKLLAPSMVEEMALAALSPHHPQPVATPATPAPASTAPAATEPAPPDTEIRAADDADISTAESAHISAPSAQADDTTTSPPAQPL